MTMYVVNNFSPLMVKSEEFTCDFEQLDFQEFLKDAHGESLINNEDLAEFLGFSYSRKYPKFYEGDVVYCVFMTGAGLHGDGLGGYTQLKYYKITINGRKGE